MKLSKKKRWDDVHAVQTEARAMNQTQMIWTAMAFENFSENTIMSHYNVVPEEMSSSSKPVINY